MPCLDLSTNVILDGVDADPIFSELTKTIAAIVGRPPAAVMVVLRGSMDMRFGGSSEPAAYAELASMDCITSKVKRELISAIGAVLESRMGVPRSRFVFKLYHIKPAPATISKL